MFAATGFYSTWQASNAAAQSAPTTTPLLPEPIYWKQNLFLIPYQWSSTADPGAAQTVWLLVSKDGGATWHKISEAKPHVKAFNYRAEADGEYLFAIRTVDARGQAWPTGPYQAELRVVVDTTMPRIDELTGELLGDGRLAIRWRATDLNLNPSDWQIEAQWEPNGIWRPVPLNDPGIGQILWQPPAGAPPTAIRATALDRAGNSAVSHAVIRFTAGGNVAGTQWPTNGVSSFGPVVAGANAIAPLGAGSSAPSPPDQQWPANTTARGPFRLAESSAVANDAATIYGTPNIVQPHGATVSAQLPADGYSGWTSPVAGSAAAAGSPPKREVERFAMVKSAAPSHIRPLEPFRETTGANMLLSSDVAPVRDTPVEPSAAAADVSAVAAPQPSLPQEVAVTAADSPLAFAPPMNGESQRSSQTTPSQLPPGAEAKQIGARTFALEYQLTDLGQWGVSRVELWGTHDSGQTWQRFADDEDHRSPLYVTVDSAGLYGFRIVVEATGGPAASVPRAGDEPELWVAVDLDRPRAELTAIQPGSGLTANQLVLRWRAEDANLEPRPIALLYSSRPSGPWSAIATGLANTGEYTWHVERHVPPRIYLRLEARDAAGNLAAFQTAEPLALPTPQPAGELQSVVPAGPTATGAESAYR